MENSMNYNKEIKVITAAVGKALINPEATPQHVAHIVYEELNRNQVLMPNDEVMARKAIAEVVGAKQTEGVIGLGLDRRIYNALVELEIL